MPFSNPRTLILIGLVLVLLGFILPILMVMDVVEATFLLSFIAHGASVSGLVLGFAGTTMIVHSRRAEAERNGLPLRPPPSRFKLPRIFRRRSRSDDDQDRGAPPSVAAGVPPSRSGGRDAEAP